MSLKVKICGLTNLEDARFCAAAGADWLGFIQCRKSPRFVAPEAAGEIIGWVHGPQSVGVFVNEDESSVNRAAETASFAYVQLHGEESPQFCARIERPVIKAIRIDASARAPVVRAQMGAYRDVVDFFLLDTYHATLRGGTGTSFDWSLARSLSGEFPILLSGGLGPHNIQAAVAEAQPMGVDLSSRLEVTPGKKDFDRVTDFFAALDPS